MLASDVYRRIEHAIGGKLPKEVSPQDVANEAGRTLVGMRGWHYLGSTVAPVSIVAGQDYMELPGDFAALEDVRSTGDLYNRVRISTGQELNEAAILGANGIHFVAVVTYEQVDIDATDTTAADKRGAIPILRLSPTPDANVLDTLQLVYTRTWTELSDDNQAVTIPHYMEALYLEVCGSYARAVQNPEDALVGESLARVMNGLLYLSAAKTDASMSPTLGVMRNGIGTNSEVNYYDNGDFSDVRYI
jgi:hypothetical protein